MIMLIVSDRRFRLRSRFYLYKPVGQIPEWHTDITVVVQHSYLYIHVHPHLNFSHTDISTSLVL